MAPSVTRVSDERDKDPRCIPAILCATERENRIGLAFTEGVGTVNFADGCRVRNGDTVGSDPHDGTVLLSAVAVSQPALRGEVFDSYVLGIDDELPAHDSA